MSITGTGAVSLAGAIAAVGGVTPPGPIVAGHAGGAVSISGATIATSIITASGSAGAGADMAGGNGGAISIANSDRPATFVTTTLTANTGARPPARGRGRRTGGAGISVSNSAGNLQTGSISTAGGVQRQRRPHRPRRR